MARRRDFTVFVSVSTVVTAVLMVGILLWNWPLALIVVVPVVGLPIFAIAYDHVFGDDRAASDPARAEWHRQSAGTR